jgi:hypothetical protein
MIGLWLLVVIASVVMAQDRTAEFNTVQCEAFRNVVAASFLPSSPCFNKNGGQIGINKRAVRQKKKERKYDLVGWSSTLHV